MGDIVNLRIARKRQRREREKGAAAEHRVESGLSKAERRLSASERKRATRELESHRIVRPDGG
jgi:hypothetical protein